MVLVSTTYSNFKGTHQDEMGPFHFFELVQVRQNRNGLQGLPQTHLVRQNPVDAVFVVPNQPVQAFQLVRPHGPLDH